MPFSGGGGGGMSIGGGVTTGTSTNVLYVGAGAVLAQTSTFTFTAASNRLSLANTSTPATSQTAFTTGDYLTLGLSGAVATANKTTIILNNQGWAAPASTGVNSNGDKIVFWSELAVSKIAIGITDKNNMWFQCVGSGATFRFYALNAGSGNVVLLADWRSRVSIGGNDLTVATSQTAIADTDYLMLGLSGASSATNRTTVILNNQGHAAPSNANATSNGDKIVFWNAAGVKTAIGITTNRGMTFQSLGASSEGFQWHAAASGTTALVMSVSTAGLLTLGNTTLLATSVALTNGAAAAAGTLTNAPAAGNPTKWIPINDNGVTRHIPAW